MLTRMLGDRQVVVWLVLLAATLVVATVGLEQHGGATAVGVLLMAIAFVKLRLVAIHFMELRDAPPLLRGLVEGYVVVVFLTLVVLYLVV